jgi:hypothetical protein
VKPVAKTVGGTGMSAGEEESYPSPNPHAGYEEEVIPHPAVADYRAALELIMPRGDQNYGGRLFGPSARNGQGKPYWLARRVQCHPKQ